MFKPAYIFFKMLVITYMDSQISIYAIPYVCTHKVKMYFDEGI